MSFLRRQDPEAIEISGYRSQIPSLAGIGFLHGDKFLGFIRNTIMATQIGRMIGIDFEAGRFALIPIPIVIPTPNMPGTRTQSLDSERNFGICYKI